MFHYLYKMNHINVTTILSLIILWILVELLDIFVAENIDDTEANKNTLPDIIHNNINIWPKKERLPSVLVISSFIYCLLRLVSINTNLIALLLLTSIILRLCRILVYSSTLTPSAMAKEYNHCKTHLLKYIGISFNKEKDTCADNMFSGHTLLLSVPIVILVIFSNYLYEKIGLILYLFVTSFLIINSRMHYTSDVIIANLLAIGFVNVFINLFHKYKYL